MQRRTLDASTLLKIGGSLLVFGLVTIETVAWFQNSAHLTEFPSYGTRDTRHGDADVRRFGLATGLSRQDIQARITKLGFRDCYGPEDQHFLHCRWIYRELLNPYALAWILEIQFVDDHVTEIASLSGYGFDDH
jgi:hypothetical protein